MAEKKKNAKEALKSPTPPAFPSATPQSDIVSATASYEYWLSKQTNIVNADIARKHQQMAVSPFVLLRATFYRFAEQWELLAGDAKSAPIGLVVGDLHIENFGTWRDAEGRLVWGVNDFDETCYAPVTVDLVRLATSAVLAIRQNHLSITPEQASDAILDGYKDSIKAGGRAFVLAEAHGWLRDIAVASLKRPTEYWQKLINLPPEVLPVPESALECLERLLPDRNMEYKLFHRVAGEGSLGRPRYTGIASYEGGFIARDVKAMLPSAWQWASSHEGPYEILNAVAIGRAVRCHDPLVHSTGQWVGRRIAPDCSHIELINLKPQGDEINLLTSMGWETGNIHIGTPAIAAKIKRFLKDAPENWLSSAAVRYADAITKDWEHWKTHIGPV